MKTTRHLPESFLANPIAHRGYHDERLSRPENSVSALCAAIARGYGAELDVQISADRTAMVFHDDRLERMTDRSGMLTAHHSATLCATHLKGTAEAIPTLAKALETVGGKIPLLIELKSRRNVHALCHAVLAELSDYTGPVALMSFSRETVDLLAKRSPYPTGYITETDVVGHRPELARLIASGAAFISHAAKDLPCAEVANIRAAGYPVLCWTVRSRDTEAEALQFCDNITFEGYAPAFRTT